MENSDHMKQIEETSGIELIFENKSIVSEVDWKSKVCFFVPKSFGYKSLIWGHFGTKLGRIGTPKFLPRLCAVFERNSLKGSSAKAT